MKAKLLMLIAVLPAVLTLSGCGPIKKLMGGGKVSGQVAATVDGQEVTVSEVRAELRGFSSPDPKVMKAAENAALQRVIVRDLLVQKAKAAKLDKTPRYTFAIHQQQENLLAQLYEQKLAAGTAQPSRADAESFVAAHPGMFANRRVLVVDQIITPPNKIPAAKFAPLKTLDEVKALLAAENVPHEDNVATIDTLTANPRLIEQLDKLPANDVFIVPQRGALVFNRISQERSAPVTADAAVNTAMNILKNQKTQATVGDQVLALYKGSSPLIRYNSSYGPPPEQPKPAADGTAQSVPATPTAAVTAPVAAATKK